MECVKLRPYQEEALKAIEEELAQGVKRQILNLATGLGKTITFSELIRRRKEKGRALVIAHRDELITQAVEKMTLIDPLANIGIVKAECNEWFTDIVVASVQSLHEKRLKQWSRNDFKTIIIDEAHHAAAPSYKRIIEYFDAELLVGVTATPYRADKITLGETFEKIVYSYGILEGIKNGYLVDIKPYRIKTEIDLDKVRTQGGDFKQNELATAVNVPDRNKAIIAGYKQYGLGKKAIVFTADVAHAIALSEEFNQSGIPAGYVHGSMPKEERKRILDGLKTGAIKVVTNFGVLVEGFDEPSIEVVILARPTKSLSVFTQMVGRGTRPSPGKKELILLDLEDSTKRHKIITVNELIGIKKEIPKGKSIVKVLEEEKREQEEKVTRFIQKVFPKLEIEAVDGLIEDFTDTTRMPDYDWRSILDELEEFRETENYVNALNAFTEKWWQPGLAYNFASTPLTKAQLSTLEGYGWNLNEAKKLTQFEASWCIERHLESMRSWKEQKAKIWSIVLGVTPEEAVKHFSSPWQYKRASEKQMKFLKRNGITPPSEELSAGEASIIIEQILTNQRGREYA
jgi:superfamily II DNA or RNA helicase